ncbi:MAG TPA: ATP-binding protein [Candidatus Acidoferrales bacterium]|nr:ATP-binding protein [Candidatus Acidoferrales bacterium]
METEPIKVLLVEDNAGDARLLREVLSESQGSLFELIHVDRLSEALRALQRDGFSAILLDLSLPDAHGLETIGRLRSAEPVPPIVVLTGLNDEEMALKAVQEGAQDYLVKGQVDGQLLMRSLRYAIQRHRAEAALKQRNRELQVLRSISETVLGSLELKSVLDRILDQAITSGAFDLGNIRLLDAGGETLRVVAARGYRNPDNIARHRALSRTAASAKSRFGDRIFREPCIEENVQTTSGLRTLKKEGVEAVIEVPVRADHEVIGLLQLASRTPRRFKPEEINLLLTIGNQLGLAVQKAQLYEQTRKQAQELEEANRIQADFTAMMAHDLRSPLSNQIAVAEMLKEGLFGAVSEEQKKWLERLKGNAASMVELINDFLDLSKLESGRIDLVLEAVALEKLIDKAVENFEILARDKRIALQRALFAELPEIVGDARRLDQVFTNLLSNAVKFTNEGGTIEVGARLRGEAVEVYVADTGIGIPKDEIGSLFKKYRQTTSGRLSAHKGTGLGLVICKMIVEAHGGAIWVESEEGKGTTFYFTLPARGAKAPGRQETGPEVGGAL